MNLKNGEACPADLLLAIRQPVLRMVVLATTVRSSPPAAASVIGKGWTR